MDKEVFVVGSISYDSVTYDNRIKNEFLGGGGLNICIGISHNGIIPSLISTANKETMQFLKSVKSRIDFTFVKEVIGDNCKFSFYYDPDGNLQKIESSFGVAAQISDHFKRLNLPVGHYHIACRDPLKSNEIVERLVKNNLEFSLDFMKTSISKHFSLVTEYLRYASFILVNAEEYSFLRDQTDVKNIEILIVTAGSDPVTVYKKGKKILIVKCEQKIWKDVTGAGDVFYGSFIANYIKNKNLKLSIRKAIIDSQETLETFGVWNLILKDG